MEQKQLKDVKKGEFFRISDSSRKTYTKGEFDISEKKYVCNDYEDISHSIFLKSNRVVFVGFTY